MNNKQIVQGALDVIRKTKAAGEIYLIDARGVSVTVLKGEIENLEFSEKKGAGIRILRDGRIGFSFTSNLSKQGIEEAVRKALDNSVYAFKDSVNDFPSPFSKISPVKCFDPFQEKVSLKERIEIAKDIERFASEYDPRIVSFFKVGCNDSVGEVLIVNTQGINFSFSFSKCFGGVYLTAKDESGCQGGDEVDFALSLYGLSPQKIGQRAARKAINRLGAKRYETKRTDLVFDPEITAGFFVAFAPAFYANNVLKGKSLFEGRLGQKIASDKIVLIDDGRLLGGANTKPVDAEGVVTRETTLIKNGYLVGFLHNFYTSQKMNTEPTGNACRFYQSAPVVGVTNLYLKPGPVSRKQLLNGVKDGLYIDCILGLHGIDSVSGEFSLGASGRVIENGELTFPVEGIAIAGNIMDLLNSVAEVADDLRLFYDGSGGCTILLEGISVSGK